MHDALTGLPNRGYLRDRLERVLAPLKRDPHARMRAAVPGRRPLQGDQRQPRPPRRRRAAEGSRAAPAGLRARARRGRAPGRRRVRDPARGRRRCRAPRSRSRSACWRRSAQPLQVAGKELRTLGQHRHRHRPTRATTPPTRCCATPTSRCTAPRRWAASASSCSTNRCRSNAVDVLAMEGDLREALQQDQFEPYFQPIVRLDDRRRCVGYEALIRWNHPQRGVLGPGDFLRIAEDSGSIEAIDWRMFELSCALARASSAERHATSRSTSRRCTCAATDFGDAPAGAARAHRAAAVAAGDRGHRRLAAGRSRPRARACWRRLRDAGVGAALDDFGTGYSSLSYLHTFPLRIAQDRPHLRRRPRRAATGNSASGGRARSWRWRARSGMEVVAEGIETEAQRGTLLAMGCEFGQGYLLGRPARRLAKAARQARHATLCFRGAPGPCRTGRSQLTPRLRSSDLRGAILHCAGRRSPTGGPACPRSAPGAGSAGRRGSRG